MVTSSVKNIVNNVFIDDYAVFWLKIVASTDKECLNHSLGKCWKLF